MIEIKYEPIKILCKSINIKFDAEDTVGIEIPIVDTEEPIEDLYSLQYKFYGKIIFTINNIDFGAIENLFLFIFAMETILMKLRSNSKIEEIYSFMQTEYYIKFLKCMDNQVQVVGGQNKEKLSNLAYDQTSCNLEDLIEQFKIFQAEHYTTVNNINSELMLTSKLD